MLFRKAVLDRIAEGEITLAFRVWRRPSVRAGGRLRTPAGELAIHAVDPLTPEAITDAQARAAGATGRDDLLSSLSGSPDGTLYRIRFTLAGPDSRRALAADAQPSEAAIREICARLDRLDAHATTGAWTRRALALVRDHPGRPAAELAACTRTDRAVFKRRIRRLKELGLTESLPVGYRLSARGETVLRSMAPGSGTDATSET